MKIKRKIILFLSLLSLFYCVSLMQETYAKYVSSANASASLTVARWNVLVNNQDIIQNSNFSSSISPTFSGTANIKNGIIAPTAEGYFDVVINGTNTDVSFQWTITLEEATENTITDLEITKYSINNIEYPYGTSISRTIALNDASRVTTVRIFLKWNDGNGETMDNEADTQATIDGVAAIKVNLNVVQIH